MQIDRLLTTLAIVISIAALAVSVKALRRDVFGTSIANYDLSSPENTLKSIHRMVVSEDVRAGWQLLKGLLQDDADPEMKLFLSDNENVTVLKSTEVTNSSRPENNGIIVSYVKFTVSGVEYHAVLYFRKDQSNQFHPTGAFFVLPFDDKATPQDKALQSAIDEFKTTGKL